MDDNFLSCSQCNFYHTLETGPSDSTQREIIGPTCANQRIFQMTSYKVFETQPDFGCKFAFSKDADVTMEAPKYEPAKSEFFTCENCMHFESTEQVNDQTGEPMGKAVLCCNSSVLAYTADEFFKPTPDFGCKRFESKHSPGVPIKVDFD